MFIFDVLLLYFFFAFLLFPGCWVGINSDYLVVIFLRGGIVNGFSKHVGRCQSKREVLSGGA